MSVYEVRYYDDLEATRLSSKGKDHVLAALDDVYGIVWLESWLLEDGEKDLTPMEGTRSLCAITDVENETEKAWQVRQGESTAWVPKSCAELYIAHADGVEQNGPQAGLNEFAGGAV